MSERGSAECHSHPTDRARIERESDESQAKFGAETSLQPLARGPRPPTTTIDLCLHCDCEKAGKFTFGWWNEGEGGRGQIQFAPIHFILSCPSRS